MKAIVIYHRADFDGIFCREVARKFLGETAEYIGWHYGDAVPEVSLNAQLYILDLSIDALMDHPNLIWIDHHKSAIEKYDEHKSDCALNNEPAKPAGPCDCGKRTIPGYRIDGVGACRLAWQWFNANAEQLADIALPGKQAYVDRAFTEPLAVRLAGEYDIWDKRDSRAELFQHALRSRDLDADDWTALLTPSDINADVDDLLERGEAIQYAQTKQNESIIKELGFTFKWEGLTFLVCNHARYNSLLFTSGLKPEHDACFGFKWLGQARCWEVSLYHAPGKEHHDLSLIAVKHGGGGHRGACGFRIERLPFLPPLDFEVLGWAWAEACSRLDKGQDPRQVEMPEVLARYQADFHPAKSNDPHAAK